MWEVGGATLSAIGLSLLIGLLGYVDGMTYAKWQYSISPNAVISVLSAFTKAVMLVPISSCLGQLKWNQTQQQPLHNFQVLDDASRGPWGSLSVFWKIRSPLAIMGATLTILSVALDLLLSRFFPFHPGM
ncbi:hypothetical protein ASPWEDRAFT_672917 [Aspergillus wentii DTO 134E9]|uniref:Uncharacterized protein n=1 Tax=Aspergillus wentii DTO 134E9 TaxID=1073089 RepID=A0A1L9R7F2_ASPWE|nr:uncharacterized protein ASPWEDRAFT_672917 [Aspergillus wentii DTO 134E9]OJJ30849.1 hypothetical protein ASPWEDRAFT_672917 [Aspergillus wentii DTO 134E9]